MIAGMVEHVVAVAGGAAGAIVRILHAPPAPGKEWTARSSASAVAGGVLGAGCLSPMLVWWLARDWPDIGQLAVASGSGFFLGYAGMIILPEVVEAAVNWIRDFGDADKDKPPKGPDA